MERRCCRASCWASPAKAMRSGQSRRWHRAVTSFRWKGRSPTSVPRNAAIARPRFCSPLKHSYNPIPNPRATKSKTRSRETFAAAPATSRSMKRWSWRRRACGAKKPSRNGKRCMAKHRVIGKALRKVDAVAKVTGATRFADDLAFPRMLYCRLLRSTEPHARIVSIDVTAAKQLAGVQAVLTGPDLPIPFGILPVSQDEHTLCVDKVRFIGDPVAAVAATSEEAATAATDLIRVDYEPLKSFDSAAALRAPRARQGAGAAGRTDSRHRDAERRRLRRQERSVQSRDRGREARDDHGPAGEDHADAGRGILLSSRPPPDADVGAHWCEARWIDYRNAFQMAARRRGVRLLRRVG